MSVNALNEFMSGKSYGLELSPLNNFSSVTPVLVPELDPENFVIDSLTGNAVFDVVWTGGEYFVNKTLTLKHVISDVNGFDPANVNIKWYEFDSEGRYTPSVWLGTGDTYTITSNEIGSLIGFEISFLDNLGTTESIITYHDGYLVGSSETNTPNTARNVITYPELETYLTNNGLGAFEPSVKTIADTLQGKWGGALGTAPAQLTFSITGPGQLQYSALQRAEHTLYQDLHDHSTASGSLSALKFSNEDVEDIREALSDWSKMTGISFVDATSTLGLEADIVFTKLDFAAWYADVYGSNSQNAQIDPGSAGFAFAPTFYQDFLVGDVFLSSDLVARNLDTKVYNLTTTHVTTAGLYVLRGNDTDGFDAFSVNQSTVSEGGNSRTVYSMTDPDTPTQVDVFATKGEINSANLTVVGYLDGGMSVKGVASHEIGHALGLSHPHDGYFSVGDGSGPDWTDDLPNYHSVMSYESSGFYQTDTPMMYDYWAMKALYGGPSAPTGDNTYTYDIDEFYLDYGQPGFNIREMLHDPDGMDTLTLVSQLKSPGSAGVYFNLNKGASSNFESVTPITDSATQLANANFILSDFTEIEILSTTVGDDVVDAKVNWAATVNAGDGADQISTIGYGATVNGGAGSDRLIIEIADRATVYVQKTSDTSGSVLNKADNSLFCQATDVEFITIIDNVSTQQFTGWNALAAQLLAPSGSGGSGSGSGSGGDAAYAGASGEGTISGAPDLTGKTIYSIDASTLTETGSLSGLLVDGLYVFDGSDVSGGSGGWDAYRLGGNAQQGWNVVEKVTGAYSASTIYSSEPAVGTLGARIVEISGATYDVYTLTSANNSVDGNFAVVEVSAGTFTAYAVTGAGTPESPFVMGAENTSATGLDAVTSSIGQVFEFAADDGSNLDGKNVALIGNDTNGWDAFEAHGGDGSAFALGDKVADDLFALESDITTQSFDVVGYLETATSVSYAGGASDELLFEIQRVAGERYGNIVTYGVKLVDGEIGETVTFDSLTFNVKWENDANGADYSFWGQFKPAAHAPAVGTNTSGSGNPVTFFNEGDGTGITFGMYADTGIKFDEGEYIATFMLEKTNTDDENSLYLNTAQYTLYDATDMGSIKSPETPHYGTQADDEGGNASLTYFDFGYANHTIGLNLEADNGGSAGAGQDLADVELLVTDIAKGEGLSLVPIAKNGNLIQYQVVMNVPIPIFIQADTDTSVDIDPDYKIVITGADIFDESVSWLTDLADGGSQTEALVAGTSVFIDGAAATATQKATTSTYTGHNFYDTIVQALDPLDMRSDLSDLATSNSLTLEIKGLNLPDVSSINAEGRYVLAEFTAISGATTAITYQSSQGDGSYGSASSHVISRIANADGALAGASSPWDNPISDGSEITAMAESIYTNEQAYNDAIGAEDALGALRISRDTAATAAENRYSQAQIIAADFNMDGRVSSADAYDILHYAVHGHESNGPTAQWVFVDDIANNKATPKNVKFDNVIDLFVGESFDINATAVLLGDVSQSYSGPPTSDPTWTDTAVTALEALSGLGIADMALQFAAANGTATGTAGRDLIYVGTTGAYDISNYQSAVTSSLMSGDIIALNGAFPTLSFATYTSTALNYDSSASGTPPSLSEILAAADAVVDNSSNAVKIEIVDNASNGANPTSYVLAIDMSGDGTLSATDDLIITTVGSAAHYVSNPLNPEIFTLSEFTA